MLIIQLVLIQSQLAKVVGREEGKNLLEQDLQNAPKF